MLSPLSLSPSLTAQPAIHVLHENDVWVEPLRSELTRLGLPYREWFIDEVQLNLLDAPPPGVFYNRMSASSHTRNHRHAWEATRGIMSWLEAHGRRVVNDRKATAMEVSKVEQVIALKQHGLATPKTVAVTGREALRRAAAEWRSPFILKPNRGGKGTGVTLIRNARELEAVADRFDDYTLDGTVLLQEYIQPAGGRVLRLEFVGGQHLYTVSIDAAGGFELCPSDACQVGSAYCPADGLAKFEILPDHQPEVLDRCLAFLAASGMEVAAMEAAPAADGTLRFYDVNINTNYNAAAEARLGDGREGMKAIAEFLGQSLQEEVQRGAIHRSSAAS